MISQNGYRPAKGRGFTLIELMIAIVIASVLLAIAIPSWSGQVRKSRRTDAKNAVLDLAGREERYMSTANIYSQTTTDLGYSGAFPQAVGSGYYNINVTATAANPAATPPVPAGYVVTATALGTQTKDTACASFSINQIGLQSSTDINNVVSSGAASTCWN
jgi:type IV pilus assembly protein PilE